MDELQLIGYTADLQHLVFCDARQGTTRFKVAVDDDLFATMLEVLGRLDPERADQLLDRPTPTPVPPPAPAPTRDGAHSNGHHHRRGRGALAGLAVAALVAPETPEAVAPVTAQRPMSMLSPRQIQSLLRAGKTVKAVAKLAECDEAWVQRWLVPIEAERSKVIEAAQRGRLTKARLGPSRDPLGEAVRRNLRTKGVDPSDESVEWTAARRDGDSEWTVTVRYRSRGRPQQAVWGFDPDTDEVTARNPLAAEIAWTRSRRRAPAAPAKAAPAPKATPKTTAAATRSTRRR